MDFQWKIQKIEIFEKSKNRNFFDFPKIFNENFWFFDFSIFRKFRFFQIFIENPMKILIFRENSGAKNLQLQIDLSPKLRTMSCKSQDFLCEQVWFFFRTCQKKSLRLRFSATQLCLALRESTYEGTCARKILVRETLRDGAFKQTVFMA